MAAIIFAYCSFSDVADGRLARKHNLVSEKGNYIDPLADKILMIGTLSILAYQGIILLWAYWYYCWSRHFNYNVQKLSYW